jgi:hypothetical protein
LTAGAPVSQYLLRLANDLSSIPKKALGYQRREKVTPEDRVFAFKNYKSYYFSELVADVWEHLPKALQVRTVDISNPRTPGGIQLQSFEPLSE